MKSEVMNNKEATANRKLPISKNPNTRILKRDNSKDSSGNLPTPIRALRTSFITKKLCR